MHPLSTSVTFCSFMCGSLLGHQIQFYWMCENAGVKHQSERVCSNTVLLCTRIKHQSQGVSSNPVLLDSVLRHTFDSNQIGTKPVGSCLVPFLPFWYFSTHVASYHDIDPNSIKWFDMYVHLIVKSSYLISTFRNNLY